ncbi:arginine--tRNA ligase [Mesoplasma lactucae]|uniref:Arginine--tRNA ligase n=1 Tax=Mesoplasma lactucae ATCC 49193 TaxID=81460 RepID=A0A291IR88_9MOLU|nr:arginine--tRNA ligase [Mesoplasma lactucae ATCC 49193]ATZ20280.1 arginyl-tRNA synthetase [Mesoplasma lactucae ATCC 49193]MCL8216451.1 Arginine--tRNA ligase [Mesoplasma lactucae ATCC 49193]
MNKTIYQAFKELLINALKAVGVDDQNPQIELNKKDIDGHYATSAALANAKKSNRKPMDLAIQIRDELLKHNDVIETIDIAGPGFINVTLTSAFISKVMGNIDEAKDRYGAGSKKDYIVNIEEVSANPTGYLHVGHARNAVIGDSLARMFKFGGYEVQTEYYVNDAGNQIDILAVTVLVYYLNKLGQKVALPEQCYKGEGYEIVADRIVHEYGEKFKDATWTDNKIDDEETNRIFREKSTEYFLDIIKAQLKDLGVQIDYYNSEKELYKNDDINKVLTRFKEAGATYEQDGALFLNTTKYGDDKDRVLIKSDGSYTYLTPDLASHEIRIQRTKANKLINVWGGDHHGYIARVRAGLEWLGSPSDILEIEMIQIVRVIKDGAEFKMSKRAGTAVWLIDLLDIVGKDALRYMLASKASDSHMDLDLDVIKQKNASNPVYYAQYATARLNSVLEQGSERGLKPKFDQTALLKEKKEQDLLITLDSFQETVETAIRNRAPQMITEYIQTIARQFHSYYADFKIVDVDNLDLTQARLGLAASTLQVLKNAFGLIGITPKEEM